GDRRLVDRDRQADRLPAEARQGADDRRGGRMTVEDAARTARNDSRGQPVEHDRGVAMRRVDAALDLVEPVAQRGVVDLCRWSDVGAEEPHVEPFEAAERPEALSPAAHGVDRRPPVDPDAEPSRLELPGPRADPKRHWNGRERVRLTL